MYQKRFTSKRLNAVVPRAVPRINVPQKRDNKPFIIGGVVAAVVILIIIVSSLGGGEEIQSANTTKVKDFSALIKEAKGYEDKGIELYNSVESSAYRSNLSSQEKKEIGDKLKNAIDLMAKAQGIYSGIDRDGGTIPSDARPDLLSDKINKARFALKTTLE